jgi:hypothetical protein
VKTFQQAFLERLEAEAKDLGYNLIVQSSAANVMDIDVCPNDEGFTSVLTIEAHFSRKQSVFHFSNPIMSGKSEPRMAIVGANVSEADNVLEAFQKFLSDRG